MSRLVETYTLGQHLAKKEPHLSQYALNSAAHVVAMINVLAGMDFVGEKLATLLTSYAQNLGEALAVAMSDLLTQLGLKVGETRLVIYASSR